MNAQTDPLDHNKVYCFACKQNKYSKDFSVSQFKKALNSHANRDSGYVRQHRPTCKNCTATTITHLTCKQCDRFKLSSEFSKAQRRSKENACCLKCSLKLQKEELSDYDDSEESDESCEYSD